MADNLARNVKATGRELLALRHAKAAREARSDFDRPLTDRGRRDAARVGRWLLEQGLRPDGVVSSPARRAAETARLVVEAMAEVAVRWEERAYEADADALLRIVRDLPPSCRRVLLVGHNPGLEELVRRLARKLEEPEDGKLLRTAGLARLQVPGAWRELADGDAELVEIVRPASVED